MSVQLLSFHGVNWVVLLQRKIKIKVQNNSQESA
jgi:hypothetical protein